MTHHLRIYLLLIILMLSSQISGQQLLDRVNNPLSPAEERYKSTQADLQLLSTAELYANPAYTQWNNQRDSTRNQRSAIVYAGMSGADSKGDFLPYEGNGSTDYRVGAYGEYTTTHSGTLSGSIQYAQGNHRHIGWNATRLPELFLPYISTDSCGGTFKFDSYYAEGNYGFTLKEWTLGVKGSFYGEQAFRLTDPRALNNTTWLRFNVGAAHEINGHLLMVDAGYGRNKQHMQLRYWRPGQQDRFFVCYGFGLYDTRQSGVSFGKSRMYYIHEYNARLQYQSPQDNSLRLHASIAYSYDHMQTEESDIYDLYESKTHTLWPLLFLTYHPDGQWQLELAAAGKLTNRKGYENIIEEYLIDKENNIYDFRTIDTRQNYGRDTHQLTAAAKVSRLMGNMSIGLQGGLTSDGYKETYKSGNYCIKVNTLTPHAKLSANWQGKRDGIDFSFLYARQEVGNHDYNVSLLNQQIAHLDFQHAFAPYAYRTAHLNKWLAEVTWQHQIKDLTVGVNGKVSLVNGHRLDDVNYTGSVGFSSSAPMISPLADTHQERWGSITVFVQF